MPVIKKPKNNNNNTFCFREWMQDTAQHIKDGRFPTSFFLLFETVESQLSGAFSRCVDKERAESCVCHVPVALYAEWHVDNGLGGKH